MIRFGRHLSRAEYDVQTDGNTPKRQPRRQFSDEFKAGAVRLVRDEGKTVSAPLALR